MTKDKIEKVQKLNAEIENFKACYDDDCKLWGDRDDAVTAETLIEFLIEHPEFQIMAENIKNLDV